MTFLVVALTFVVSYLVLRAVRDWSHTRRWHTPMWERDMRYRQLDDIAKNDRVRL